MDGYKVGTYERAREVAALDAALRSAGGLVLPTQLRPSCPTCAVGSTIRGPSGEHWLIVGQISANCPWDRIFAMDEQHAVFEVTPAPIVREERAVRDCTPTWWGCGGAVGAMMVVVAEVPPDARLVIARSVSFPVDVRVEVQPPVDANGAPILAPPPP